MNKKIHLFYVFIFFIILLIGCPESGSSSGGGGGGSSSSDEKSGVYSAVGLYDATFNSGNTGADNHVNVILIQSDGLTKVV